MTQLLEAPIADLARGVQSGRFSAEELVRESLEKISEHAPLNAFLHVSTEAATANARMLDERRARGERLGPLAGVPIAVKDALCTADAPTTAGSRILCRAAPGASQALALEHAWRPPYDATVVTRLRAADAVLVGKTNMDEFAMGSSNENSAFGPARNPHDPRRSPGGSSGGSAVAVAAGTAPAALGSDTGGSIRQPAAFCGVVGVKPSYGRVSRYGLIAFASSLDQVGPFARDVRSAARVLEVIAGADARDSTAAGVPVGAYEAACERNVSGLRLGVPRQYFDAGIDPEVEACVRQAIDELARAGCRIVDVDMPHTRYGVATYYVLATAEASSNLARFDGVRFGARVEEPNADLAALYEKTRGRGFGREVKRRILLGTYALSAGYYDAYYRRAQLVRTLIARDFENVFREVDALVTPASPTPAFELGERSDDPLAMYLADVYTLPASLAGIAGMTLPGGFTSAPRLPVGVQLLVPAFEEERLFALGAAAERLLAWKPGALPGLGGPTPERA